jgi:hypothetical protein
MAASPADLCELADLKAWLNIPGTTDDGLLQRLLTAVSTCMQNWMNRTIPSAPYTETRDGSGSDTLCLGNTPITAVTSLVVNGIPQVASSDGSQPGFVFSDSAVYLIGSRFPVGRRNVQVVYTAGFATVPVDLAQACIEQAAHQYLEKSHIGQSGTGMGPEHISFREHDFTPATKTLMNQYRKVVPV